MAHEEERVEVDRHDPTPLCEGEISERLAGVDAGGVDKDARRAEVRLDGACSLLYRRLVADVAVHGEGATALTLDVLDGVVGRRDVEDADGGPIAGESQGDASADPDPGRRSGDHSDGTLVILWHGGDLQSGSRCWGGAAPACHWGCR